MWRFWPTSVECRRWNDEDDVGMEEIGTIEEAGDGGDGHGERIEERESRREEKEARRGCSLVDGAGKSFVRHARKTPSVEGVGWCCRTRYWACLDETRLLGPRPGAVFVRKAQ